MGPALLFMLVFLGIVFLFIVFRFIPVGLWITALASGVRVSFGTLFGMRFRKVVPSAIVNPLIAAHKAGIKLPINALESHYLAGGRVPNVITALIAANRANIDLSWKTATAIDLAGRDILDAVQTSVNPKVIDCPQPTSGKSTIDAVAKDGIQLKALALVTVRANLDRLVGGAGEETI
ncbi:MAG: flotillin-like FloA family protein, partial [Hyphomicrobiaceae bacterium]|nr:flotillin-like FloA family protein [Hyphomicrobiaceae bacterium]